MWCVAELNKEYIAKMEDVLKTYERPYDPQQPVVCLDEKPWAPGYVICVIHNKDEISGAVDFLRRSADDLEELSKELAAKGEQQ